MARTAFRPRSSSEQPAFPSVPNFCWRQNPRSRCRSAPELFPSFLEQCRSSPELFPSIQEHRRSIQEHRRSSPELFPSFRGQRRSSREQRRSSQVLISTPLGEEFQSHPNWLSHRFNGDFRQATFASDVWESTRVDASRGDSHSDRRRQTPVQCGMRERGRDARCRIATHDARCVRAR